MNGRARGAARRDRSDDPARRVAELEAEVAALRRALAEAGRGAGPDAAAAAAAPEGGHGGRLLAAAPNPYLVLRPDPPRFTIIAASDAYLRATMTGREDIVGRGIFDVFPDDPADPAASGVRNLRASLGRVLASRAPDRMPVQRYDIRRPYGAFEERHWSPINLPVPGRDGAVEAIIHHVEDVTALLRPREPAGAVRAAATEVARANAELGAANAALREREERLRLILDSAADYAIIGMGLDRRVASWNAGAERLLGWAEAEIVGRSADTIFTPEDRAGGAPEREAEGALRDGRAANERWHVRKDGTRFWGSGLALPLRDPGADPGAPPLGLLKVMRDRTEERRAEEALRASEARFRALVRASSDALYRMSPDWSEMRQLSGGGFIADAPSPRRDWMEDYIHPDDRPLVAEAIRQAIGSKGVFGLEHRVRRPDGSLGWTLSRAVPVLGADGGVVEWFGAASDVTARRGAEERLRASEARWRGLFGSMQEGFAYCEMVYGPDGRAVDYRHLELNAAWGRLTGVPNEAVQGKLVSEAVPGIEPYWLETYARVVETGEPAHFEYHLAAYGRWFEVMAYRTEPGRFAAVFLNVTERKAAEARRALLVNELNHRVKNTLAVVQSLALQTARGAADLPSFSAAFQARLIALARAHDLLTRGHWEGAALGEVVRAALEGGGARADLDACVSPGALLPPAQALALAMALHELATNALKHGALSVPEGSVAVTCRADPDEDGAWVVEWAERGGPPVAGPPARKGFGLRLLERGLAAQAGMAADLRFEPGGVRCVLRLPPPPVGAPAGAT